MKYLVRALIVLAAVAAFFASGYAFGRYYTFNEIVFELPPGRNVIASSKQLLRMQPEYSQFKQDLWVAWTSGPHGRYGGYYVDVGSADATLISNTYLLDRMGWKGVCIDPFPTNMQKRTCQVFTQPVFSESGKRVSFRKAGVLGGIESDLGAHKSDATQQPLVELTTATLDELLAKAKAPNWIDYMNVDVEGAEYDALLGLSFDRYQIGELTIEHNYEAEKREKIRKLMEAHGYVCVRSWLVDDWYVHRDLASQYETYLAFSLRSK